MCVLYLFIYDESLVRDNRIYLNKHDPIVRILNKNLQLWDHFIHINPKIAFNRILGYQDKFIEAFSDISMTCGFDGWIMIDHIVF